MLLSRVASDIYWLGRYVERAENIARLLDVNYHLTLDFPEEREEKWGPLIFISGDEELFKERYGEISESAVLRFLAFDTEYPNSILSSLMRARENARTVRDRLSIEIWEEINSLFHRVCEASQAPESHFENPFEFCRMVKMGCMLISGLAEETWQHGEEYLFFQLGSYLERADKTTRFLDVKYFLILPSVEYIGTAYDNIQWSALLRSCSGHEAYRNQYGITNGRHVVGFLLLDRNFPRSVLYCLNRAEDSLRQLTGTPRGHYQNAPERALGQLCSNLMYADELSIIQDGLHEFIDGLQSSMNAIDQLIHQSFFL